jgi:ADP-heptose:LPS heptosyltransferase
MKRTSWRFTRGLLPGWTGHLELARRAGLGDVLLCTPTLRALKEADPTRRVVFFTDFGAAVSGLPYIDRVLPYSFAPTAIRLLKYEGAALHRMPPTHLARLIGRSLGVEVVDVRPDCVVRRDLVARVLEGWRRYPSPYMVVQRRASRWTPNKDWPDTYWTTLIAGLSRRGTVIEIGFADDQSEQARAENYIDLRSRTSLEEMIAVIASGDVLVAPPSGPMHIAAAMQTPSVVICGGYEHPDSTAYPGNVAIYTPETCAPCWLRTPCPYDRKCLSAISPEQVEDAVMGRILEADSSFAVRYGGSVGGPQ